MILINEWLPNPAGSDAQGEWVELRNSGSAPVDISGWRLTSDGKKFFALRGIINPGGYVVVPRSDSKLTLRNTDGGLALYDASGRLADHASFQGSAPEGESANRTAGNTIFFGRPTPGAANTAVTAVFEYNNEYPVGVPLGPATDAAPQFMGFLLGTALALAAAVVFILKTHEDLSHLFFGRDQGAGS